MIRSHLKPTFEPVATSEAVVIGPYVRFTVLTPQLLRLEYSPTDTFEDRPSQAVWYRRQPAPDFEVVRSAERVEIITAYLHLRYQFTAAGFSPATLSITLKESGIVWNYGDRDTANLGGTTRTLDQANGPLPLEPGLLSKAGWVVVDDSGSLVFNGSGWLESRPDSAANLDLYFFGYGHHYEQCLQDFYRLTGPVSLIPRWALGNWWSRYWPYTQAELTDLMRQFQQKEAPLSVCIIDMDWHITDTGNQCSGWTGFTWNTELFPDPASFLAWLHGQGLKTALNLHPAEGVFPHEAAYKELARLMGIDPASQEPVEFDIADPKFTQGYFDLLLHPLEAQGVDFWWIDWQQGTMSKLPALDPLWWLNHLHFYDLGRDGRRRPFIFSRWGGLGNHRYPIGFSGDTHVTWESLAFQPYFTATASNVGYSWWSHDIGGHMSGFEEAELFTRWVQYGVFSPIFRLHSTNMPYHERRPWGYDETTFQLTRQAMQLRHALIPYLYTMAWRNHRDGLPLIAPMYHRHPNEEAAYVCPNQYYFGRELLAAPYIQPLDPDIRLSRQVVWLPAGDWFDFFTGDHYPGDCWQVLYGSLDEVPVFARAGAIVPLGPKVAWGGVDKPASLILNLFPGADNHFELYEDDGESTAYTGGSYALTPFRQKWAANRWQFKIEPVQGDAAQAPPRREYELVFRGINQPEAVEVQLNGAPHPATMVYDESTHTLTLSGLELTPTAELSVILRRESGAFISKRDRTLELCHKLLHAARIENWTKGQLAQHLPEIIEQIELLADYRPNLQPAHWRALAEIITGAGYELVTNTGADKVLVLWNNQSRSEVQYHFATVNHMGRVVSDQGEVPPFKAIHPFPQLNWRLQVNYSLWLGLETQHRQIRTGLVD